MATRFELVGLHRVKLLEVRPLQIKLGQKDMEPGLHLRCRVRAPAKALDMIDAALRPLLFKKHGTPTKAQPDLDGVPSKTELSPAGVALRTLSYTYEQTGCKFVLYGGVSKIVLNDVTIKKALKLTAMEGEAVDIDFNVFASHIDAETMGEIGVRKQHEVEVELLMPEVLQKDLEGETLASDTPIGALSRSAQAPAPAAVQ